MDDYGKFIGKKRLILVLLFLIFIAVSLVSIMAGSSGISLADVFKALAGRGNTQTNAIVLNVRLPRIATSAVVGCALALAGCVMQGVLKNPLASSSTLGVSQGASFGATVAIIYFGAGVQHVASTTGGSVNISNPYIVTVCAFAGGMICILVILGLSRLKSISASSMVLAGVALGALFTGATALIQYFASDVALSAVVYWTFGDLGRASWPEILIIFVVLAGAFLYFMTNRWNYNALQSGDETAKSLGVNVNSLMLVSLTVGTLISAAAVSFVGIINFIGLIAPHIMRKFVGEDYRFLLPASTLAGACILLLSDLFSRTVASPVILPIGAITSFLGAPLFIYLIYKGGRGL
ncbi:MAG: iron ABC transporter permease [Clostridia bacterium]|nr:iron ABC transporter permease [Clostridia bacterium]